MAWHLPRRSLRKGTGALGHCCRQNRPGDNASPSAQISLLEVQTCVIETCEPVGKDRSFAPTAICHFCSLTCVE